MWLDVITQQVDCNVFKCVYFQINIFFASIFVMSLSNSSDLAYSDQTIKNLFLKP